MNKICVAMLSLCAFSAPVLANSNASCNAQTTKGAWVYTCEGTLPAPTQTAARILGRCTATSGG